MEAEQVGPGGQVGGDVGCDDLVVWPVSSSGDHAAMSWGWVLSWASMRCSRLLRSVQVNVQVNGQAMAL